MATTGKMFVKYSNSKEAFIAAGLPSQYKDKIVFISGGTEGSAGECIYTQGRFFGSVEEALAKLTYFSSISDGTTTATATGPNNTIVFSSDDNSAVQVIAGSNGVSIGLDADFTKKVDDAYTAASNAATKAEVIAIDAAYQAADTALD